MANPHLDSTRKRGPQPSNLSVRLFLLDPDKKITKVTNQTCSKESIQKLMQKGYGPPQPEHCTSDDKVKFPLTLTNEQFKEKLVEIYPKLVNSCFVLMKADKNNQLAELNPGICCFRCYTPESVYHSERGQGRLYVQKINENKISQCTHGVSKRFCSFPGYNQQHFVRIQPKHSSPAVDSSHLSSNIIWPVTNANHVFKRAILVAPVSTFPGLGLSSNLNDMSGNVVLQQGPTAQGLTAVNPNMVAQSHLLSAVVSKTMPGQPVQSPVNVTNQLQPSSVPAPTESDSSLIKDLGTVLECLSPPEIASSSAEQGFQGLHESLRTPPWPPTGTQTTSSQPGPISPECMTHVQPPASVFQAASTTATSYPNMTPQNLLLSTIVSQAESNLQPQIGYVDMVTQNQQLAPTTNVSHPLFRSGAQNTNRQQQSQLPTIYSAPTQLVCSAVNAQLPSIQTSFAANASTLPYQDTFDMASQSQLTSASNVAGALAHLGQVSPGFPEVNSEQLAQFSALTAQALRSGTEQDLAQKEASFDTNSRFLQSFGLASSADAAIDTEQREQREEYIISDANIPNEQEIHELATQNESSIDSFLENVKSTGKLEISLALLGNDNLMEKLNAFTINIRTVEIESTCKLQQALKKFSLPSCLTAVRIKDNILNCEDIFALVRSLASVNELHELDLSCTTFSERSSSCFLSVLVSCRNLTKLCLTDNSFINQDINCLVPAFESMKNLVNLTLSKTNLTETQACDILQKQEGKNIISLDLSQNALQGNEITVGICHLQSLTELDLSHNHIRFYPLPKLEKARNLLPANIKIISLSSNYMTPIDISRFCRLVSPSSVLVELNLDFNQIDSSIWSLSFLGVKHLKVLSLAHTAICGHAVEGLASLLLLTEELEGLNLSSNNLMLADFQELSSPLSKLTQLKRLNLSNNPDGISVVLHEILPSLKNLEELILSNVHLNGDDCTEFCKSLASLKGLKYLDLSKNAIGPNGTKALASVLMEFPLLQGLDMSKSHIKEDEISVLCKKLVHLNRLKYLNLSGNRIDVEVLGDTVFLPPMIEELILSDVIHGEKLLASMTTLQHLRILHLSEMLVRPSDVEALAVMLPSFLLLEDLVLSKVVGADCDKIFSAIKSFKNIENIDLTGIQIRSGNIFAEMSLLSLKELVLANINVVDREYNAIFSAIKSFRKLKKLDLTGTKIPDVNVFTEMLLSLWSLKVLVLANVSLEAIEYEILFSKIKFLKTLRKLNLDCEISTCNGDCRKAFIDMLSSLPFLEDIVFPQIVLNSDETTEFCYALKSLKYLKNLDLQHMMTDKYITKSLIRTLPSLQLLERVRLVEIGYENEKVDLDEFFGVLVNLRYLRELYLESLVITQNRAKALVRVSPSLHSLEKLLLINISCDDECSESRLFAAVKKLRCLKELVLVLDGGLFTSALAEALPSMQLLEKLTFRGRFADKKKQKQFVFALRSLKYLTELDLVIEFATQIEAETLAEVLPSLQLLKSLVLSDIDVDFGEYLSEALSSLRVLRKITLRNLVLSKSDQQLFTAVGSLSYLKKLDLRCSKISPVGARNLIDALASLRNLTSVGLPEIQHDENEECIRRLKEAVRQIPRLKEENY